MSTGNPLNGDDLAREIRQLRQDQWIVLCGERATGKSRVMRLAALDADARQVPFLYVNLSGHYLGDRWRSDPRRLLLLDDWELPFTLRRGGCVPLPPDSYGVVAVSFDLAGVEGRLRQAPDVWAWPFPSEASVRWVEMNAKPSTQLPLPVLPASWREHLPGDMFTGYEYFAWPPLPADPARNRKDEAPAPLSLGRFAETQLE